MAATGLRLVRIVVASPGDVAAERTRVTMVVNELNHSLPDDRALILEARLWETDSFPGFHPEGPQALIDAQLRIPDCDLLVGVFWKRFGTPTRDAKSGTEHEFRLAYQAWRENGKPQVMVYFCQKPYTPKSREETDQWGQVLEFREAFPAEGLWWPYEEPSDFERLFRTHLNRWIRTEFPASTRSLAESKDVVAGPALNREYFGAQRAILAANTRLFVGRANVQTAIQHFLTHQSRGYFIVRGVPGQGKTALACELIRKNNFVHHLISRTGGRSDARLILRSLVSQLRPSAEVGEEVPQSISDLTKRLEDLLIDVGARRKPIVVIIDALDEAEGRGATPPYLVTDGLPEGAFYVVTSRAGEKLDRLLDDLFSLPHEVLDLEPLEAGEMSEIVERQDLPLTASEVSRITEASKGNPLYLRALADEIERNPNYDLNSPPANIEAFFRSSLAALTNDNPVLADTLGLLCAARKALSARELASITGLPERHVDRDAIGPIRHLLVDENGSWTFFHQRFLEFLLENVIYPDELRRAHRRIANWLGRPENFENPYRWTSLAWHLAQTGDDQALMDEINAVFLEQKVRRFGYAVLEDVDLLSRCLLGRDDPSAVERCVSLVEQLRAAVGGDIVSDTVRSLKATDRESLMQPDFEAYAAILPKAGVAADFLALVPCGRRLLAAIGDAPGLGLKSAFVARFLGSLFSRLAADASPGKVSEILDAISATISTQPWFDRISMQCIEIDGETGIAYLANAGHPFPVHFSRRRVKCGIVPVFGNLLNNPIGPDQVTAPYQQYPLEMEPGDLMVLITDGLTEGHVLEGDAFGYRFTEVIESASNRSVRDIAEGILEAWKTRPRQQESTDDASVLVIALRESQPTSRTSSRKREEHQ